MIRPDSNQQPLPVPAEPANLSPRTRRFLEILPGAAVWAALTIPTTLSLIYPTQLVTAALIFSCYRLVKGIDSMIIAQRGLRQMRHNLKAPWKTWLEELDDQSWKDIHHAILFPAYKEPAGTLRASLNSLVASHYDPKRLIPIIATEERDQYGLAVADELVKEFKEKLPNLLVTQHPGHIPGEVQGKGANATWGARALSTWAAKQGIPAEHIVVTTADADCRFPVMYFDALTYQYFTTPDRTNCAFQPIATFFNNIWQTVPLSRFLSSLTTFWQMSESVLSNRLITFSTHAMSLKTLQSMDYWSLTIVNEDSRQFFRAFYKLKGKFRVVPLYLPVYMDAVHAWTLKDTLKGLYQQQQRWAYGVEHTPYVLVESWRARKEIPLLSNISVLFRQAQGHFLWATTAWYVAMVSWLPYLFHTQYQLTVTSIQFSRAANVFLVFTALLLAVSFTNMITILPDAPEHMRKQERRRFFFYSALIWVTSPLLAFVTSIPSIDAHTRLMFGKYLGFKVTEKTVV